MLSYFWSALSGNRSWKPFFGILWKNSQHSVYFHFKVSVSTLSTSQIQNPNYCGEGHTSSSPSNLDGPYKQETTRSKSNCSYEELQYAEAGTLVVREPEDTDTARSAAYAEAGTLVVREPERTDTARSASYKYMDMTTPTHSVELSATLPVRGFDSSVQYSVVRKESWFITWRVSP